MDKMCKFSIIIPVYNVERYLRECLDSVLNQTYLDYEVILVDDGSTDSSGKICDEYKQKNDNIKVYHQKNQGLSCARNIGIEKSKGEYFWLVDSDDIILKNTALEELNLKIEENHPDIVGFGWKEADNIGGFIQAKSKFVYGEKTDFVNGSGVEYLDMALTKSPLYPWYACMYLYKKEYWVKYQFCYLEGKKFEDVDLTHRVLLCSENIIVLEQALYGYRVNREGSIVTSVNTQTLKDGIGIIANNIKRVLCNDTISDDLKKKLTSNFSCTYFAIFIASTKLNKAEQKKFIFILKENYWIAGYAMQPQQKIVKKLIDLLGFRAVQNLLKIRRILKHGR